MNASPPQLLPTRVLVVDDDRLVLATVAHGLSQAGYEVIDADNGDDAILLARQYRPALALLDIRMEGLSGFDVAEYLRTQLGTPFMFLSAFADDETRAKVAALGAVAYLTKPLDIRQIVPAVQAALARLRVDAPAREGGGARAGADEAEASSPASASAGPPDLESSDAVVALALGILMHRHTITRDAALERLQRAAVAAQRPLQAQARQVLAAIEQLARTPPL